MGRVSVYVFPGLLVLLALIQTRFRVEARGVLYAAQTRSPGLGRSHEGTAGPFENDFRSDSGLQSEPVRTLGERVNHPLRSHCYPGLTSKTEKASKL